MRQLLVLVPLFTLTWVFLYSGVVICQRPSSVNIGAIFTFNSVIGRVAKPAIEAAVSDINADPRILNGTKLKLITEDANCSAFLGSVEGKFSSQLFFFLLYMNKTFMLNFLFGSFQFPFSFFKLLIFFFFFFFPSFLFWLGSSQFTKESILYGSICYV